MAALSKTNHISLRFMSTSFFSVACGHDRTPCWLSSNGNTQNLQPLLYLPSNAVFCRCMAGEVTIRLLGSRQPQSNQESVMGEPFPGTPPSVRPPEDRLDSWKEIAAYLNRDVTTVQRWEKREGMPVYRRLHDRMGSVYASRAELDAWTRSRNLPAAPENESNAPPPSLLALPLSSGTS